MIDRGGQHRVLKYCDSFLVTLPVPSVLGIEVPVPRYFFKKYSVLAPTFSFVSGDTVFRGPCCYVPLGDH